MMYPYEMARGRLVQAVDLMMQQAGLSDDDRRALAEFRRRWERARSMPDVQTTPQRAPRTKKK